ncbi:MAG: DUF1836 domain-containing protein [Erysipelotrichaceae bacterium]|nr:DUF1836 domain-containing protein [Erysipelotrichaceae bacterium]
MKKEMRRKADLEGFRLPTYTEIPDVGLFLDQVSKYISTSLYPLGNITCTSSMIANYVKKNLIRNPIRKQYDRSQIAALFLISVYKNSVILEDLGKIIPKEPELIEKQYLQFAPYYEAKLREIFFRESTEIKTELPELLQTVVTSSVYKTYIDSRFVE